MRSLALLALTAGFLVAADKKDPADKEPGKLEGTWTIVTILHGTQRVEIPDASTVVFQGSKYKVQAGDQVVEEGTFKLDTTKTPHWIDVETTAGQDKGKKWHGVYELKEGVLKATVATTDKERPTKVGPAEGTRSFHVKQEKKESK